MHFVACEGMIAVSSVPTSEGVSIPKGVTGKLRWGLKKLKINVWWGRSLCLCRWHDRDMLRKRYTYLRINLKQTKKNYTGSLVATSRR